MRLIQFIIYVLCIIITGCKKDEGKDDPVLYDLFPLNIGNEYFYSYKSNNLSVGPSFLIGGKIIGTEEWKVESSNKLGTETNFLIKRTIDRYVIKISGYTTPDYDTVFVTKDSVCYLNIHEDADYSLSFGIYYASVILPRYYIKKDTIIRTGSGTSLTSIYFSADSGLTAYYWGRTGNKIINESLALDSLFLNR